MRIVASSILLLFLTVAGYAQDATTGQIVGNVMDATDAVIANAQVTVKNVDTGQARTVPANAAGHFAVPLLPPGRYTVSAVVSRFAPLTKGPVNVPSGTSTTVNLILSVEGTTETVSVEAGVELLQTESASNGFTTDE